MALHLAHAASQIIRPCWWRLHHPASHSLITTCSKVITGVILLDHVTFGAYVPISFDKSESGLEGSGVRPGNGPTPMNGKVAYRVYFVSCLERPQAF
jgi:hypothetical protein